MDEPPSALDALAALPMRNGTLRILDEDRRTVLLSAYYVAEVNHVADRMLVLSPSPTRIQASIDDRILQPRKVTSAEV